MRVTIDIPDALAAQIAQPNRTAERAVLEALAMEAYRNDQLSESEVRQMLGLETRMEVHALLKQHGIYLQYTQAEIEQDRRASDEYLAEQGHSQAGKQAA